MHEYSSKRGVLNGSAGGWTAAFLLSVVLLANGGAPAAQVAADNALPPSLVDFELRSLIDARTRSLSDYQGRPLLMTFFQPDCLWCLRQVRALNALLEQCPQALAVVGIGVNGDRPLLKKTVRRLKPDFPAFEASEALLEAIGSIPAVPFTLLADAQGRYRSWLSGYTREAELKTFLSTQVGLVCEDMVDPVAGYNGREKAEVERHG